MSGKEREALCHVEALPLIQPALDGYLDDSLVGAILNNAFRAPLHRFDEGGEAVDEAAQRPYGNGRPGPEYVVAIARTDVLGCGVELCVLQLQPLVTLAINVNGLTMVEIDAIAHQVALEGRAVVV